MALKKQYFSYGLMNIHCIVIGWTLCVEVFAYWAVVS